VLSLETPIYSILWYLIKLSTSSYIAMNRFHRETCFLVQQTFNNIALAYRNNLIPRELALACLTELFGENLSNRYMGQIDAIEAERVPPLPEDYNVEELFNRVRQLKVRIIDTEHILQEEHQNRNIHNTFI